MKYTKADFVAACIELKGYVREFVIGLTKIVCTIALGVIVICGFAFLLKNFLIQTGIMICLISFGIWFSLILESARQTREYNEQVENWRNQQSKPAHDSQTN